MNAYGMGGTIRTTLNLVEHLAETHEVELISVIRRRERPLFRFPDGVEVTALDDRRSAVAGQRRRGWRGACGAGRACSSTPRTGRSRPRARGRDLQLIRKLRSLEGGVLITTRPAFNLIAAKLAPARGRRRSARST